MTAPLTPKKSADQQVAAPIMLSSNYAGAVWYDPTSERITVNIGNGGLFLDADELELFHQMVASSIKALDSALRYNGTTGSIVAFPTSN